MILNTLTLNAFYTVILFNWAYFANFVIGESVLNGMMVMPVALRSLIIMGAEKNG